MDREGVHMAGSSGFHFTAAGMYGNASAVDATSVTNATRVPIESLLGVRTSTLQLLSHVALQVTSEDGVAEDVFYTVVSPTFTHGRLNVREAGASLR